MQLQVVAGRGGVGAPQYAQYARHQQAPRGYAVCASAAAGGSQPDGMSASAVKFTERGVPEGAAASVSQVDGLQMMSPTSGAQNCMQANAATAAAVAAGAGMQASGAPPGAVFYAMNV